MATLTYQSRLASSYPPSCGPVLRWKKSSGDQMERGYKVSDRALSTFQRKIITCADFQSEAGDSAAWSQERLPQDLGRFTASWGLILTRSGLLSLPWNSQIYMEYPYITKVELFTWI